jgi:hypothetical protein
MTLRLNGSTSGYVEIDAPATAGSNTLVLPTGNGTSGQVLSTNGSGALSWAQGGRILQVVSMTTSTETIATTTTYVDTTISLSIAPSLATSKVLVMAVAAGLAKRDQNTFGALQLLRGSSALVVMDGQFGYTGNTDHMGGGCAAINYLDSPATTSSITYKVQVKNVVGTGQLRVNWDGNSTSSLVLLEVAA